MQTHFPRQPRSAFKHTWRVPEFFNIASVTVDQAAARFPHRLALIEPQRQTTFAQAKQMSERLANALRARGVKPGDRVGLLMGQGLECALSHMAVYKIGGVVLPLSVLFGLDAFEYRMEHSGARHLIAERGVLDALNSSLSEVEVVHGDELEALISQASPHFTPHPTKAEDPTLLIYTSGTTGKPKGALLPHRSLIGHMPSFHLYSNFPGQEAVYWTPADWAWAGGLLDTFLPAWASGFTVLAYRARRFDPEEALDLMRRYQISDTFLFPTAIKILRGLGELKDKLSLHSVHAGGEPVGAELLAWVGENLGTPVNEFYGQTEANIIVGNSHTVDPIRPGSMGLPFPGHRLAILDPQGNPLPAGEVGEVGLLTPDPVIFLGYWQNPEASKAKFAGPYLKTGDVAAMDQDGYLWFKGRADDMIKSAGYRISPFEVEEALIKHPSVAMAAVVGVPDEERGQRIVAHIKLKPGSVESEALVQALQDQVRKGLGRHAYPREIHFVSEMPMTTTGKIQRFKLR